jgi:hypothetical protein
VEQKIASESASVFSMTSGRLFGYSTVNGIYNLGSDIVNCPSIVLNRTDIGRHFTASLGRDFCLFRSQFA